MWKGLEVVVPVDMSVVLHGYLPECLQEQRRRRGGLETEKHGDGLQQAKEVKAFMNTSSSHGAVR